MTKKSEDLRRRSELRNDPVERLFRMMEIRCLEETVQELFDSGAVQGTTHLSQGQEAVAVALASVLEPSDPVSCTYRGHAMGVALGLDPGSVLAEILGKRSGCAGGLGGSMHLVGAHVGLLPTSAIVGAGMPIASGFALASKMRGTGQVAVAVFGDGATNIGVFHEAMNLASVWRLPLLFLCENNLYGEYTRIDRTTPIEDIAVRAASYAIDSEIVDGQDIDDLVAVLEGRVAQIRTGGGPVLIEAKTYRYSGHSRSDAGEYRPNGELQAWLARDPISISASRLTTQNAISDRDVARLWERARSRVDEAREFALGSPEPEPSEMFRHLYAGSDELR